MKSKIPIILIFLISATLCISDSALADRDWEYWSQESLSIPIKKEVNFLISPEWKFKDDMQYHYSFKLETGPSFKINKYLDITPYYVYQEKKSGAIWDRSDLVYLDETIKFDLKDLFDIKFSNRFRYQYDFDKGKTTLRDSLKVSRGFKIAKFEISPYLSEEPFYDAKLNRITEHRTSGGIVFNITKNTSFSLGYMLNLKKGANKWAYSNVLVSNLSLKF